MGYLYHWRSGSVTTVLHEAAEEYIRNIEVPKEYDKKNRYSVKEPLGYS